MENALFGADEWLYLSLGVEFNAKPTFVKAGHGLTQLGNTRSGLIAVGVSLLGLTAKRLDGLWRGRHVGAAYGQRDDVFAFSVEAGHLFAFP